MLENVWSFYHKPVPLWSSVCINWFWRPPAGSSNDPGSKAELVPSSSHSHHTDGSYELQTVTAGAATEGSPPTGAR